MAKRDGKIVDIGDLGTSAGKLTIDAAGCLIMSGRAAFLADWSPQSNLNAAQLEPLLSHGVTTVFGALDLADGEAIEAMAAARQLPVNWGFVGRLELARNLARPQLIERVALAASRGLLAVVGNHADEALWQQLDRLGLPLLQANQLPPIESAVPEYRELARETERLYKTLGIADGRGRIERNGYADLLLVDVAAASPSPPMLDWRHLKQLVVAGETVWENGKRVGGTPGVLLRRGTASN
jgi:cytosine/adenosine deaminase-related metal-dependent hydrolase